MKTFNDLTNIQRWYNGRNVFVTGGTGFMGKVLVEKLLRCCPTIGNVYLLVREKNGWAQEDRHKAMIQLPMFRRIHEECPHVLDKLIFIEGNLLDEDMGIASDDKVKLIEEVSVVFHLAASLKLEAGLKHAVLANTLGTKRVLDFCSKMKKIQSVVHLSTAFCHCNIKELKETLYEPNRDPYEMIKCVQEESDAILDKMKKKTLEHHPNSYTFSKCLAEWVVKDYAKQFPVAIARPSVVIPALKEPLPGWVDSLNGPIGIMVAAGKGIMRSLICNEDYNAEVIPVDLAINALITLSVLRGSCNDAETMVYNVTCPREVVTITWGDVLNRSRNLISEYPFEWTLWYPDGALRTNKYVHWMIVVLFQWLPALFIDAFLMLIRTPTFMVRLQKKLVVASSVLEYFTTTRWHFNVDKSMHMTRELNADDKAIFYLLDVEYNLDEYMVNCILGARKFCMKEDIASLWFTRIHFKVLQILHYTVKYYLWYCILWYVFRLFHVQHFLHIDYWYEK